MQPDGILLFHSAVQLTLHLASRKKDVERWASGEAPSQVLKSNRGRSIWRVAVGHPALFVKRFPAEMFRDRARKEATLLLDLEKAGIPCPRLVALARDGSGSRAMAPTIRTNVAGRSINMNSSSRLGGLGLQ